MTNLNAVATEPVRQTEVDDQMSRVQECTQYIDKMIGELETALSKSILAQHKGEDAVASTSAPEPVRVPLAQRLYDHSNNLEHIRVRLSSILSRIEA